MLRLYINAPNQWGGNLPRPSWFSFHRYGRINKNRSWEVQLDHFGWYQLLNLELILDWYGTDHAGPVFEFTILGFMVRFEMPRNDHWDHENNCWEEYDEESNKIREDKWEEEKRLRIEDAYFTVAKDVQRRDAESAEAERLAREATPEGQAELKRIAEEAIRKDLAKRKRDRESKKARGEEHQRRNREALGDNASE